jgi:hypothetical protein
MDRRTNVKLGNTWRIMLFFVFALTLFLPLPYGYAQGDIVGETERIKQ